MWGCREIGLLFICAFSIFPLVCFSAKFAPLYLVSFCNKKFLGFLPLSKPFFPPPISLQASSLNSHAENSSATSLPIAMPLPAKSTPRPPQEVGKDSDESSVSPSNNLWVGSLVPDVTNSDLMDLFAQYGALDSMTSYSSRSYAFVFFKRVKDAKAAAKNALQGFSLCGISLKIEFARPVLPICVSRWI